jgi:hypothetical protein
MKTTTGRSFNKMNIHLLLFLFIGIKLTTLEGFSQALATETKKIIPEIHYPLIIEGMIKDSTTKKGVPYAQIIILEKEKMKKGGYSDSLGNFKLEVTNKEIRNNKFNIKVALAGYITKTFQNVDIGDTSSYKLIYIAPIKDFKL